MESFRTNQTQSDDTPPTESSSTDVNNTTHIQTEFTESDRFRVQPVDHSAKQKQQANPQPNNTPISRVTNPPSGYEKSYYRFVEELQRQKENPSGFQNDGGWGNANDPRLMCVQRAIQARGRKKKGDSATTAKFSKMKGDNATKAKAGRKKDDSEIEVMCISYECAECDKIS